MKTLEDILALLPPERRAKIERNMRVLKSIDLGDMTDAALGELYDAVGEEISRRDRENQ